MRVIFLSAAWGMMACAGGQAPAQDATKEAAAPAAAAASVSLEKSSESGAVDRVGSSDGALSPDGTKDLAFVVKTDGPVEALFLVVVDAEGKPDGTFQADTLVGDAESPAELGAKPGRGTAGLGVFEDAKGLNGSDGNLQAVGAGTHNFTLYVAPSPALAAGTQLRVYVQRPDKTLVASTPLTN